MEIQAITPFPDIDSARDGIRDLFGTREGCKDIPVIVRGLQGDFVVDQSKYLGTSKVTAEDKQEADPLPRAKGKLTGIPPDEQDAWKLLRESVESSVEMTFSTDDTDITEIRRCQISGSDGGVVLGLVPFMDFVVPYFRADLGIKDAMYAVRVKQKDGQLVSFQADVIYISKQDLILPVLWKRWWDYCQTRKSDAANKQQGEGKGSDD